MNDAICLSLSLLLVPLAVVAGDVLDLSGQWRVRLDPQDQGVSAAWADAPLVGDGRIALPNTLDCAGLGFALDTNSMLHAAPFPVTTRFPGVKEPIRADEHGYLVRRHLFVGPAWYEREIDVPESWQGRRAVLRVERALWKTDVWLDGRRAGECDSLVAEHRHELGPLAPGGHRLTVRVDNRMIHNISTVTHAYGPETQSRWNGLIGHITLDVANSLSVRSIAAFPAEDRRSVRAAVCLANATRSPVLTRVRAWLCGDHDDRPLAESVIELTSPAGLSTNELVLRAEEPQQAWDEFQPVRYRLSISVEGHGGLRDEANVAFGFRHVARVGRELRVNGRRVFLRGTLDCAVYPRTGHPPMTVPEWDRVLGVVKEYGFNHVRFHTWCPPEAAFEAADRLGVYLQPETPAWVDDWGIGTVTKPLGIGRDPQVAAFLRAELRRMSEAYGNHPSFVLCAIGNEFGLQSADWDWVNATVAEVKTLDPRRLYTGCGARKLLPADDYWYTHQTGASTRGLGPPHTDWDFASAAESSPVPVIAHETGQRPVFPDYERLLPKFTGPLLPLNYDRFRRMQASHGLDDQTKDFVRASARFQLVQYKAEHEAMLRTRAYTGYQLLMLNDFTGQSEALVGLLDPFWESKGTVSAAEVRAWNAPTVLLARFPKFVWTADETFNARLEIAHYGAHDLPAGPLRWSVQTGRGDTIAQGQERVGPVPVGGVSNLSAITVPLVGIQQPEALTFTARFADAENRWALWLYPTLADESIPEGVRVTATLDDASEQALRAGGKVLLLAHGLKNAHAAPAGFASVYWSAGWWGNKFSSLGVLCAPGHPALEAFPNQGWSDWQWHDLCTGATTIELDGAPPGFRPIVQLVPDFHFNTLLAYVFEARVAGGSLLVCGFDLTTNLDRRPAAQQFRRSLLRYAGSAAFRPTAELPWDWIRSRCDASRPLANAVNLPASR